MTTREARLFLTRPQRLEAKRERLVEKLEEMREGATGLQGVDYSQTRTATGRHDGQERRIIHFVENSEGLRAEILETGAEATLAIMETSAALDDLAPQMEPASYSYLCDRFIFNETPRGSQTTEEEALADFARAYTEREEGKT